MGSPSWRKWGTQYVLVPLISMSSSPQPFRVGGVGSLVPPRKQKLSKLTQLMPGATQLTCGKAMPWEHVLDSGPLFLPCVL